jgi:membrane-associated HD superfamily phosphohydrolase
MSSLIILSHVKEGTELAEKYRLGKKIYEIIQQHHGTSLVSFFYKRAKDQEDPDLSQADEKDFRYPGPKPQTKEAGIVMLADAVEAASRTLEDPTPKRIETHVQSIIEHIFLDGQLDECELTLKDLHAIQKSFIAILIGIFHQRIEYPERTHDDGAHKKFPKLVEAGSRTPKKNNRGLARLFRAAG